MRRTARIGSIGLIFLLCSCGHNPISENQQPQRGCAVTPTTKARAPQELGVGPLEGAWYMNADRSIWAMDMRPWHAGTANKVPWIRPVGAQLTIAGRRLDGTAPPAKASVAGRYATAFQATGLEFPTEGCWEVTGEAGDKVLRFVTIVEPRLEARR